MESMTEKFQRALPRSHKVAQKVELLTQYGNVDLTAEGITAGGRVEVSSTETRRTMQLNFVDNEGIWLPFQVNDPLTPAGNEIRLYRGIDFQDGTSPELIPIGTFRFVQVDVPAPKVMLNGFDRSYAVKGNPVSETFTIPKGTNVVAAIESILLRVYPTSIFQLERTLPDLDETTNLMVVEIEADAWSIMQDLAANVGHDLYFNPKGELVMRSVPDPSTAIPDFEFDDSSEDNMGMSGISLSWDASDVVNRVVAIGENPDNTTIYRGEAKDTDPGSPTQYDGPFGRKTLIIRDEKIGSQAQAEQRARAELIKRLGIPQSLTIPSLVHPALEAGDVLRVTSNKLGGLTQVVIADSFPVPLRANESMTIETRQRLIGANV
jgi:hypothetical protein